MNSTDQRTFLNLALYLASLFYFCNLGVLNLTRLNEHLNRNNSMLAGNNKDLRFSGIHYCKT